MKNIEVNINDAIVTVLIGPPCCGKSTYLKSIEYDFVISSDQIVEMLCRHSRLQYDQFFQLPLTHNLRQLHNQIFDQLVIESYAFNHVVWDLTNLTKRSRAAIFNHYAGATFHAVMFDFKGNEELIFSRNRHRFVQSRKWVDESVLQDMLARFEPVSKDEGFTKIKSISVDDEQR